MCQSYEAMAESLEQFKFLEYPDDLFIQFADNITQKQDEKEIVLSSSELSFRELTYKSMLDTKILPPYLREICSSNFTSVPLPDRGLDIILQNGTCTYINNNLTNFKGLYENIKKTYFSEHPELNVSDNRAINAIKERFVQQNLENDLSSQIVDFISTYVNLRDKASYARTSKQFVKKYWSVILSEHFISFEGNYLILDDHGYWVCADLITVGRRLKKIREFASLYNHVRNDSQWQNILTSLGSELKNVAPTLNTPFVPLFAVLVKFHLLDCINHKAAALANQDVISDFKNTLQNNFKNIGIPSGADIKMVLYLQEAKLRNLEKFPSYETVIAALYQITDGRKSLLDEMAKLFAKIFLGRKICKTLGITSSPVTVITTNNLKFLYDFLQSIFTLRLKQDPYPKTWFNLFIEPRQPFDITFTRREVWFKIYPNDRTYYMDFDTRKAFEENRLCLTKPENALLNPGNNIADFYARECRYKPEDRDPMLTSKYNLGKHDLNDYFHITHYNLSELCSEKFVGKFIEDKLHGNFINVNINQLKEIKPKLDTKQFVSMCKGRPVTSSHDFFKGEQTYISDTHFVFLQDAIETNELFSEIQPEVIELSQKIPSRAYLFAPPYDFLPHEQLFVAVDMAVYGLELLLQQGTDPKLHSIPEPLNLNNEDVLLDYFFKHCCRLVKIGDEETPTLDNATCPKVLMKGFQSFCKIVSNDSVSPSKMDKNVRDRFLPDVRIYPSKTGNSSEKQLRMTDIIGMKERLADKDYTIDNDGVPKDKTNWWMGIVEKSLNEIKSEANKLLIEQEELRKQIDSLKETDEPLSPTDFIKLLAKIGKWEELYKKSEPFLTDQV